MTIVINLFGSSGAGKSTAALDVCSKLKQAGRKVEYLPEYAKKMIYMGRESTLQEQVYIFAKQMHELDALVNSGIVDIVVSDSPLPFSVLYAPSWYPTCFRDLVLNMFGRYHNVNIFVNRVKPYVTEGRIQTEAESDKLAIEFRLRLKNEFRIHFEEVDGDELAAEKILAIIAREEESHV